MKKLIRQYSFIFDSKTDNWFITNNSGKYKFYGNFSKNWKGKEQPIKIVDIIKENKIFLKDL
jgi:hypothetical protein